MTLEQSLKYAAVKLGRKKITNPGIEAELLLSYVLKKPREYLLTRPEIILTKLQQTKYLLLIHQRLKDVPAAYLTNQKEFYGLNFYVDNRVLVPRQETELMIDEALKLALQNWRSVTLIDVGTGSGCIIVSLAKKLISQFQIPVSRFFAIDISPKALAVAKKNARRHGVDKYIKFTQGNLLSPILNNSKLLLQTPVLIILANLPYLSPSQIKNSPSIKKEPRLALAAGADGLKYYRQLFKQISKFITLSSVILHVLCEIDQRQTLEFKRLVKKILPPTTDVMIIKDLSGLNRLAVLEIKK